MSLFFPHQALSVSECLLLKAICEVLSELYRVSSVAQASHSQKKRKFITEKERNMSFIQAPRLKNGIEQARQRTAIGLCVCMHHIYLWYCLSQMENVNLSSPERFFTFTWCKFKTRILKESAEICWKVH